MYVAITPEGRAFVYRDAALRTAINEFDPSDTSPKTMVTHPCVIRPTNKVQRELLVAARTLRTQGYNGFCLTVLVQAVENGWSDYPSHIFPKIVEGTSVILKALGIGAASSTACDTARSGAAAAGGGGGGAAATAAAAAAAAAELSATDEAEMSERDEEKGRDCDSDSDVVDRSVGEGRALLCGFDWLIRRRSGELWPMLLEINTSPQLVSGHCCGWVMQCLRFCASATHCVS